jgi:hypothetical protein
MRRLTLVLVRLARSWSASRSGGVETALVLALAAALSLPLSAQPGDVRLTTLRSVGGPLPFSNPSLGVKGTIRPMPGDRFEVVVIALGDRPIVAEVRQFVLRAASGIAYEPVAVGGGLDLIFPLDQLPLGIEVGQILPSDAILTVKRMSPTSVTIDAGPGITIALVYELPEEAALRSFKLPDGRELAFFL